MTEENEDPEYTWWDEAKLNFWNLMQADKEEQFDETVGASMEKADDVNYRLALVINLITAGIGYAVYSTTTGLLAIVGIAIMVLGIGPILKWVIQG